METQDTTEEVKVSKTVHGSLVHHVLAHSYVVYFIFFLAGVVLDFVYRINVFANNIAVPAGTLLLFLATILIIWAQITSRNLDIEHLTKETFCKGPYCYTRSPTNWGLFFLVLGFGLMANALFVVLSTLISFIVSRTIFLCEEEKILEEKYGLPYIEYKQAVQR